MSLRQQAAEVPVARARLAENGYVVAIVERQLGARDRLDAQRSARPSVLHRAVQAVVVGQRKRRVAEISCSCSEFGGMRCPVEERERRVAVQLDRWHEHMFAYQATFGFQMPRKLPQTTWRPLRIATIARPSFWS